MEGDVLIGEYWQTAAVVWEHEQRYTEWHVSSVGWIEPIPRVLSERGSAFPFLVQAWTNYTHEARFIEHLNYDEARNARLLEIHVVELQQKIKTLENQQDQDWFRHHEDQRMKKELEEENARLKYTCERLEIERDEYRDQKTALRNKAHSLHATCVRLEQERDMYRTRNAALEKERDDQQNGPDHRHPPSFRQKFASIASDFNSGSSDSFRPRAQRTAR